MNIPAVQLSCQQCQTRKTKCDKAVPCSACVRAKIPCTTIKRHRLPRGRSGNHRVDKSSLRERVEQLETILYRVQPQTLTEVHRVPQNSQMKAADDLERALIVDASSFVAPAFWVELSDVVSGLRDVIESPDDKNEDIATRAASTTPLESFPGRSSESLEGSHVLLFHRQQKRSLENPLPNLNLPREWLLNVYELRVDTIFKALHWPTVQSLLRLQGVDPSIPTSQGLHALECAIYFTAVCSLHSGELPGKENLAHHYRWRVESALSEASLLTTTSTIVLQAFVIYLVGLRACQSNAQQWVLTATAIRIANAQRLPSKLWMTNATSIETDSLRRVWCSIALLDMQSSFDRGTKPMLRSDEVSILPANVDDAEVATYRVSKGNSSFKDRFTDMSFSSIVYTAGVCQRRLTEIGSSSTFPSSSQDPAAVWRQQLEILDGFEKHVRQVMLGCDASPSPIQKFTMDVAEESLAAMRLLLYRPLYKRDFKPPSHDFDILTAATEVLQRSELKRKSKEFAQWAWFAWPKWYSLAIVLSELCSKRDHADSERAWALAQQAYDDYAQDVADTKSGLLWRPIAKLMRKVKAVRANHDTFLQPTDQSLHNPIGSTIADVPSFGKIDESDLKPEDDTEAMSWLEWDQLTNDIYTDGMFDDQSFQVFENQE